VNPEIQRSPFDENDRAFRLAVKRVVADVLDRIGRDIMAGVPPEMALRNVAWTIRNEDAV